MDMLNYFIGTAQSKYAAIAMFCAILVICLEILFTVTDISVGNRVALVLFVILMSIFPILISLFELTCIVTGGRNNKYNLCNIFAWFVTVVVVIYCFILIITTLISMFTYKKAIHKITITENFNKISSQDANTIAKNILKDENMNHKEKFYVDNNNNKDNNKDKDKEHEHEHKHEQMRHMEHDQGLHLGHEQIHHLGNEHFSYEISSPKQMINSAMPSLSPIMDKLFSNQEKFENEVTGLDESSNYMDLGDIQQPTIQQVPVKQNVKSNEIKTVEPFSNTIENFYSI